MKQKVHRTGYARKSLSAIWFIILYGTLIATSFAEVQQFEDAKLEAWPGQGTLGNFFGYSVALHDDCALIGAPYYTTFVEGHAYLFRQDPGSGEWFPDVELYPSSGGPGDEFGRSVGLCGDVALVGANKPVTGYIYRYDSNQAVWNEEAMLLPETGWGPTTSFCVALFDDVAVIGAPSHNENGIGTGAAFVYRYNPISLVWEEETKLLASDGADGDAFGLSLAISGDIVLVGAAYDDSIGSAYLFRYDVDTGSWIEEAKLRSSSSTLYNNFGRSVAVIDDMALIGAPWYQDKGCAYVFRKDSMNRSWSEEAQLLDPQGEWLDNFGWSVDLDDHVAAVGANRGEIGTGVVHLYRYIPSAHTWRREARLLPSDAESMMQFGYSVDLQGGNLLVGEPGDSYGGSEGDAYMFKVHSLYATEDTIQLSQGGIIDFNLSAGYSQSGRTVSILA